MILTAAQMVDAERAAFAAGESAESLMEIAGRRYEASVAVGVIDAGAAVVVCGRSDFGLVVEKADV